MKASSEAGRKDSMAVSHREPFGARLLAAIQARGPLCVGLDPHEDLLRAWGLPDDADGLARFCDIFLGALAGQVAAVKPQAAFFERHGARGIAVLEQVLATLRAQDTLSVLDGKRGDIGSTMQAYAQAYLGEGSPLAADAVTLSPYLGVGALAPAFDLARRTGRGLFVLALTSNPEGSTIQHAGNPVVARRVVAEVAQHNRPGRHQPPQVLGSFGVVIGATVGSAPTKLDLGLSTLNGPILVPGLGAQGGSPADLAATFAQVRGGLLPAVGRSVLLSGPDPKALRAAAQHWTDRLRSC